MPGKIYKRVGDPIQDRPPYQLIYIEDITCPRVDMNFIFSCSTQYLTTSLHSLVRYRVEHEKIKFISTSGRVMFCLLYKHTNDDFFDDFPKISKHFPTISEDTRKVVRKARQSFPNIFPKISEECRR